MRIRARHLWFLAVALVLTVGGCGAAGNRPVGGAADVSRGAGSPEAAVSQFVSMAGSAAVNDSKLAQACRLLSPDIREGMQFGASVRETEQACGPALALSLYYTGET